ncbi:response regulator transcription factor [Paraburkholderia strydomiana]|uniref:response regulator transcription factor n=1 Tax=Paraburkholderia strydomiana TaxID=1245417 RepID=UPI0038BCC0B2
MRILVVEDDNKIGSFVITAFQQAGFAVDHAEDGASGLELALTGPYDAAVIDIMLPRLDGLSLIEALRRGKVATPVIILSAKRSVDDRVKGLQTGGDDYLTKPFALTELLARVHALIRRTTGATEPSRLIVGELVLDLLAREAKRCDQRLDLQPRELSLLEYLMRNAGRPISKTMILEHVWDYSFEPQTNVVDVLVCRLRNKVDRDFSAKMIHTIRGVGYVLRSP